MNGFAARRLESKSIDHNIMGVNESTLRDSLVETKKRNKAAAEIAQRGGGTPLNLPDTEAQKRKAGGKMTEVHQSLQQSSEQRYSVGGRDVALKDMLEVPDQISLQSPLPLLDSDEPMPRYQNCEAKAFNVAPNCYQNQDVLLADILKAPSLEISLRTATELDS